MNRRRLLTLFAGLVATSAPMRAQGTCRWLGADAEAHLVGPTAKVLRGPSAAVDGLAPGDYTAHFGQDALGKPLSLAFDLPARADVHLATGAAAAAVVERFAAGAGEWREHAGAMTVRTIPPGDRSDGVFDVAFEASAATGATGVVARWTERGDHYAFVLDRERTEARLERRLGDASLVLARAARPSATAARARHRLTFQLQGFRLQGLVDDEVVVQCLDGALARGACGVAWRGIAPAWSELTAARPAAPRTSAALVHEPGLARTLHVAPAVAPGHWHVLELCLDRPHPLVPTDSAGLEPWLLQRSAAPQVLLADLRESLGAGSFGEGSPAAPIGVDIAWPDTPILRLQAALARVVFVTPDGGWVAGRSPAVPVRR
jgi:hypothetical protein